MKKYLLLLLIITASLNLEAQTTLANKLKITGNITDNVAAKVNVQATDGTVNTISKTDLQDAFYFSTASALPVTGITDKLYITRDDNKLYRFNGTIYVLISQTITGLTTDILPYWNGANLSDSKIKNIRLNSDFQTNLFLGDGAGQDNTPLSTTIGRQNTFLGVNAGRFNTTGYARTDIGYNAGYYNTTGDGNCNIGYQAGFLNIAGNYNTNVGTDAGARNRGSRNSFWGWHSGFGFSTFATGQDNHILGYETAINLLTGFGNNGHGSRVFFNLTDGYNNTAMGDLSGFNLTTGNNNTLYGRDSGFSLDAQVSNSIFGNRAGYNLKGNFNTILGEFAGFDLASGNGNVYIGQGSGNNPLQKVDAAETIVIGSSAYATKNNQAVIGRNGGITETILRGKILIGTETNNNVDDLQINGTISALPAALPNQVVVKSQLDAADSGNVKLTGAQTITGVKTISLANNGNPAFNVTNTGTGAATGASFNSTNDYGIVAVGVVGANIRNNGTGTIIATFRDVNNNEKARVNLDGTIQGANGTSPNHFITKAQTLYTNQTITANKTVTIAEFVNNNELILSVNATSGNITITLPTFTALQGYKVTVKKMDSSANSVLITGVGGVNIDGSASVIISGQYSSSTIGANLSQYIIL